jgi:hypothetical protein
MQSPGQIAITVLGASVAGVITAIIVTTAAQLKPFTQKEAEVLSHDCHQLEKRVENQWQSIEDVRERLIRQEERVDLLLGGREVWWPSRSILESGQQ